MTVGSIETGTMVACSSIFTMIISKIKCYYKRPSFLCACMESNNVDNDDVHVNVATINDVELLYVSKKKTTR